MVVYLGNFPLLGYIQKSVVKEKYSRSNQDVMNGFHGTMLDVNITVLLLSGYALRSPGGKKYEVLVGFFLFIGTLVCTLGQLELLVQIAVMMDCGFAWMAFHTVGAAIAFAIHCVRYLSGSD